VLLASILSGLSGTVSKYQNTSENLSVIKFLLVFVSFTDGSDMLICSIEPRNIICNIYERHCHLSIGVRADRVPCKKSSKEVRRFHSGGVEVSGLLEYGAMLLFPDVL